MIRRRLVLMSIAAWVFPSGPSPGMFAGTAAANTVAETINNVSPAIVEARASSSLRHLRAEYQEQIKLGSNHATALRMTIQDLLHDGGFSLNDNAFRAAGPSVAVSIAGKWLSNLSHDGPLAPRTAPRSLAAQHQGLFIPLPATAEAAVAVPLPAAAWGGGILIALVTARNAWRRRAG